MRQVDFGAEETCGEGLFQGTQKMLLIFPWGTEGGIVTAENMQVSFICYVQVWTPSLSSALSHLRSCCGMLWQPSWAQQNYQCTLMFISNANRCSCWVSAALVEGREQWGMSCCVCYQPGWALQCLCLIMRAEGLLNNRGWNGQCDVQANFKGFGGIQLAALLLLVHTMSKESLRHIV